MSNLIDVCHSYKDLPHQDKALNWLMPQIAPDVWDEFLELWRKDEPAPAHTNPLQVKYQSQRDNASGTGWRECFSSTCGMVAMWHGRSQSDDQYNRQRAKFGDSTSSTAQVRTLRSLGLKAAFHTDGTAADLRALIDKGLPTPVGWLHHGGVDNPSGGGHWSLVIGYDSTGFILHDPWGEADLLAGQHINAAGGFVHYSYKNWLPRWQVGGSGGWYLDVRP
jgi:hypothetical protein